MSAERLRIVLLGLGAVWLLMLGRTFQIQVLESGYYGGRAESQSQRRVIWKPERGRILDRTGRPLAVNHPSAMAGTGARLFPQGSVGAQVVGVVGKDGSGLLGMEYLFDDKLRGIDGWAFRTVDASRRFQPGLEREGRAPSPGLDLVLTIDRDVQEIVQQALERGVRKLEAQRASAIVLDPSTGQILAMGAWPDFDPNERGASAGASARNDIASLVFEPGSTFKLVTAAAALEEKAVSLTERFDGENGRMVLPNGEVIRDTRPHGVMDMREAMTVSSNIAFAKIASKVGKERFFRTVRAFGFGSPTLAEIPGEESGVLKPVHQWSGRTLLTMAYGHEILVTPLQMAMAFAVVANGGILLQPTVVAEWRDPVTGVRIHSNEPKIVRRVISEETAAAVRGMLRDVVQSGTGTIVRSQILDFSGKTGTAEKFNVAENKYDRSANLSSFIGMVPADHPRYVCLVLVDEPLTARSGGAAAGPIFKEILQKIYYTPAVSPRFYNVAQVAPETACDLVPWVGLPRAAAEALGKKHGCSPRFSGEGPRVISQSMDGGLAPRLELGGPTGDRMPDLRGLTLREALDRLEHLPRKVSYAGKGWVVAQEPAPDHPLKDAQPLHLVLRGES